MVIEKIPPDIVENNTIVDEKEKPGTFSEDGFVSGTESPEPPKRRDVIPEEVRNAEEIAQSLAQREENAEKPKESVSQKIRGFFRDHTTEKIQIKLEGGDVKNEIEGSETFKKREGIEERRKAEQEKISSLDTIILNKNNSVGVMGKEISRLQKIIANFASLDEGDLDALQAHSSRFEKEKKALEQKKADLEKTIEEAKQEKTRAEEEKRILEAQAEKENEALRSTLELRVDKIKMDADYEGFVAKRQEIQDKLSRSSEKKREYFDRISKLKKFAGGLPEKDQVKKDIEARIKTLEGVVASVELEISEATKKRDGVDKNISGIEKRVSSVRGIATEKGFNVVSKPKEKEVAPTAQKEETSQPPKPEQVKGYSHVRRGPSFEVDENHEAKISEKVAYIRAEIFNKLTKETNTLNRALVASATNSIKELQAYLEESLDGRAFACRDAVIAVNKSENNEQLQNALKVFLNTFN